MFWLVLVVGAIWVFAIVMVVLFFYALGNALKRQPHDRMN